MESRTVVDGIIEAGLGNEITLERLYRASGQAVQRWVTINADTDEVLGTVGSRYPAIPFTRQFGPLQPLIDHYGYELVNVRNLFNGRRAVVTLKHREDTDDIRQYVHGMSAHDGTQRCTYICSAENLWCLNQLAGMMHKADGAIASFIHNETLEANLARAEQLVWQHADHVEAFRRMINQAKATPVTYEKVLEAAAVVIADLQPNIAKDEDKLKEELNTVHSLFHTGIACEGKTAFDGINAITEWIDHQRGRIHRWRSQDRRFVDLLQGDIPKAKRKARDVLLRTTV